MNRLGTLKLWMVLPALCVWSSCLADVWYVDGSISESGDGTSWDAAFKTIQEGIAASSDGDTVIVAAGTYGGEGNTDLSFGGESILLRSADGADVTIIDCEGRTNGFVFDSGEMPDAVMDGFTIRNAKESGIWCEASHPTIIRCTITNNSRGRCPYGGAGIRCERSRAVITDCVITFNNTSMREDARASAAGGIYCVGQPAPVVTGCLIADNFGNAGGGIDCFGSSPEITNCTFTRNSSWRSGGGIHCAYSSPTITSCMFFGNIAPGCGALYVYDGNPVLTNCLIVKNIAVGPGGGICCGKSTPTITNCTIVGNRAGSDGGGLYVWSEGSATLRNCIVFDNSPGDLDVEEGSECAISYSDVKGGWPGEGNISADPMLTSDFHLRSGSPCIDAGPLEGKSSKDMDGELRPQGLAEDMGADEFLDADTDALPDWWELGSFPTLDEADGDSDPDGDGLSNLNEYELHGTSPVLADTDGDGRSDWEEAASESNPIHPDNSEKVYYVDGRLGNDACDGLAAAWDGLHGPKRTIQGGIDATLDGWGYTVLVAPGRYTGQGSKDIDFKGKAISVKSQLGATETIVDREGDGGAFYFHWNEGDDSVLDGFTVSGGSAVAGCAIFCTRESRPTITRCIITDNSGVSPVVFEDCSPTMSNCWIARNKTTTYSAVLYFDRADPLIVNCTITGNEAPGGVIQVANHCHPIVFNTILWDNSPHNIYVMENSSLILGYSVVQGGWPATGNIDADPLLTPGGHLTADSPCRDAGTPDSAPFDDIDGEERPQGDGVDMGADEFLDTDDDKLPDWWELKHFGSLEYGADDDPDGDGLSNLLEYEGHSTSPAKGDTDYFGTFPERELVLLSPDYMDTAYLYVPATRRLSRAELRLWGRSVVSVGSSAALSEQINPWGLTWNGVSLYAVAQVPNAGIYRITPSGKVEMAFSSPASFGAEGIGWDGANFWVDGEGNTLYSLDADGNLLSIIEGPSSGGYGGIACQGDKVWLVDDNTSLLNGVSLYRIDGHGSVEVHLEVSLFDGERASGLAWNGDNLLLSSDSGTYHLLSSAGEIADAFSLPSGLGGYGLAWDGTNFWGVDAGLIDTLYRIDLQTGFPSDIVLDVGGDDIVDWEYPGELSGEVAADNLANAFNAYLESHADHDDGKIDGKIAVPLRFRSQTPGRIIITEAQFEGADQPLVVPFIELTKAGDSTRVHLTWPSSPSYMYKVLWSEDLLSWQEAVSPGWWQRGTGRALSFLDDCRGGDETTFHSVRRRFYKVLVHDYTGELPDLTVSKLILGLPPGYVSIPELDYASASITNIGAASATDITVQMIVMFPKARSIIEIVTISHLDPGESKWAFISWWFGTGYPIYIEVLVDPLNLIPELNEENNGGPVQPTPGPGRRPPFVVFE